MINTDSVSLCLVVRNDLPMLRSTLIHQMQWADQVCILDMGSTDGTLDFCNAVLRTNDVYSRRDLNTCPTMGFDEARNASARLAGCDWIMYSDADMLLDWNQQHLVKRVLAAADEPVLSIETRNIPRPGPGKPWPAGIEKAVASGQVGIIEHHRLLIRQDSGIIFRGYIHEEAFLGDISCWHRHGKTTLRNYHFSGWSDESLKAQRYSWMLRNAVRNPQLQQWTNEWWYKTYWPEHQADIERMADEYESIGVGS